jgi:asparagine synthase (glutamine-hydrolysing)
MCGFTGFLDPRCDVNTGALVERARRMADRLTHRGPDSRGEWVDERSGLALGYRRLAIIDLSPAGEQPMISACSRYVIAFNGEIYNFEELREQLRRGGWDRPWRGHSDTEVLLAVISIHGFDRALEKLNGMFAIALWDRENRELFLARDRTGEKPLYYGWNSGVFHFGSELKALRAHPRWSGEIDRDSLSLYLRYNCIPAPHSIYKGIRKLPPATWTRIHREPSGMYVDDSPREYWSARTVVEYGAAHPFSGSETDAEEELDRLLRDAVRSRMYADVPLGAFLSGGIDSSSVVAMMQAQSSRPVRTFTIGFHEAAYNEAADAKAVAAHLGTEHTELYVTAQEAREVIPLLPELYDEPFADSSQIPTYLVSQMTRAHVTVALSGDGGDELFGGYNRHFWVPKAWKRMRLAPRFTRRLLASAIGIRSPAQWDHAFEFLSRLLPDLVDQRTPGYKLHKLAEALPAIGPEEMYEAFVSHWKRPDKVVLGSREPSSLPRSPSSWPLAADRISERMMYADLVTYLPDDILVKVDRASMGVSLEARVPFLDHRVVEFAWTLPIDMKIRAGRGKRILRRVLDRYVPSRLIDRPKTGFGIPIDEWLRGPLHEWAESLLDESRLKHGGIFEVHRVREKWREHLSGKRNWQYHLWDILMFQAWLEQEGAQR